MPLPTYMNRQDIVCSVSKTSLVRCFAQLISYQSDWKQMLQASGYERSSEWTVSERLSRNLTVHSVKLFKFKLKLVLESSVYISIILSGFFSLTKSLITSWILVLVLLSEASFESRHFSQYTETAKVKNICFMMSLLSQNNKLGLYIHLVIVDQKSAEEKTYLPSMDIQYILHQQFCLIRKESYLRNS